MSCDSYYPKCRCGDCRKGHSAKVSIYHAADRAAAKWVRRYHRPVFERMLDEAYEAAGVERRKPGRPAASWFSDDNRRRLRLADIDARDGAA